MLLKDKVAVITGAAQGIGRSIAARFAGAGAKVVVADIMADPGAATVQALTDQGHEAIFSYLDVTQEETIHQALDRCLEAFGGVDILVNNAGVNIASPVIEMSRSDWEKVLAINLTGSFLCAQVFGRAMVERGQGGVILFMSSQAGKRGEAEAAAYAASKFGVLCLMQCLALEMAPHNIRVNAVCPGNVDTPMIRWFFQEVARQEGITEAEAKQRLVNLNPLGRLAKPAEIADVFLFLASPMASYITGEAINVDGGELSGSVSHPALGDESLSKTCSPPPSRGRPSPRRGEKDYFQGSITYGNRSITAPTGHGHE